MKLDPVFYIKENTLYRISDNSKTDAEDFTKIELPWSAVEMEDECYNEEMLATLRDKLKKMEDENKFAILVPLVDKPLETAEQLELFTNAFNHTARRVKDCVSVVGFELPEQLKDYSQFIEVLSVKHAQYLYFTKRSDIQGENILLY